MKMGKFIIGSIIILLLSMNCSSFYSLLDQSPVNHTFEDFPWGCSREYVKKHEHGYQMGPNGNDTILNYWFRREFSRFYPFTYMRSYSFKDNKLVHTTYHESEPDYYERNYWMNSNNIHYDIEEVYGEPKYNIWIWTDAEYIDKESMFHYDTYIRMGYLKREALWVTPSTIIVEQMSVSLVHGDIIISANFYEKDYYMEHFSGQLWSNYQINDY